MGNRIMIADVDVYDDTLSGGAGGTRTLRFATGRGYYHPDADGPYLPVVQQPLSMRRSIFDGARTFGASRVGYGEMTLVNLDAGLNALFGYGYGRSAMIRVGEDDAAPENFSTVFSGTVRQPAGNEVISLRFRDKQTVLDVQLQPERFAGTSTGPSGLEGRPGDLQGKVKPRLFGVCRNASPVLANASKEVWALNFDRNGDPAPVASIDAVYAQGATYTFGGTNHADETALMAASISAGTYHTCLAKGLLRTSGGIFGQLTCDVTEGASSADRTAVGVAARLFAEHPDLSGGEVSTTDLSALDAVAPYEVGLYADGEMTYLQAMDELFSSIGGWFGPDRLGVFRCGQVAIPSGTPVCTLLRLGRGVTARIGEDVPLVSLKRVAASEDGAGLPVQGITLRYARNWTVQNGSDLAGSVTDARRAELEQESRSLAVRNEDVLDKYPGAPELEFDTLLEDGDDAQEELDRRKLLFTGRRDFFSARVRLDDDSVQTLDIGTIVRVVTPDFGMQAGRLFLVVEVVDDALNRLIDLTLWG